MGYKSFKYRLYPTQSQERALLNVLECARNFYNMCLAERKWAYLLEGRRVDFNEQRRQIKFYRATFPQACKILYYVFEAAANDCDKAFAAFFRRVKAKQNPGYPRFKSRNHFRSFGLRGLGLGWRVEGRRLALTNVGRIAIRWHRPLEGNPKVLRILYKAGKWFVAIVCEIPPTLPLPKNGRAIGIDLGISALITTSDGEKVDNPKFYREAQAKLRVLQRALQRKRRGGKNRHKALVRLQRCHEHVANQRRDFAHKLSYKLVQNYDFIALEDLPITGMVHNRYLSKSILDSGWGVFLELLRRKAESASRVVVLVNPAGTSKTCSHCGAVFAELTLAERWVNCVCGLSLDRDHNAAINILSRGGWDASVRHNVDGYVERAAEATQRKLL